MHEVTIAIPVYQVEDFIEESLLSALDQTFPSIEFLMIDDCGRDGSMSIVNRIASTHPRGKNIRIIKHENNQGLAIVRNTAILNTNTKYLYFLDSDDTISANCIELLYTYAEKMQTDFTTASHEKIESNGYKTIFSYPKQHITSAGYLAKTYFKHFTTEYIFTSAWNKLYRTDFLKKNQIMCIPHSMFEDVPMIFQVILHANSCYTLPNITYYYKLRNNSITQLGPRLIPLNELQNHIKTLEYKKEYIAKLKEKEYYPELVLHLMYNCFTNASIFVSAKTEGKFSNSDLKDLLSMPFYLKDIAKFEHDKWPCLLLYVFFSLPASIIRLILLVYIKPKRHWWKLKRALHSK